MFPTAEATSVVIPDAPPIFNMPVAPCVRVLVPESAVVIVSVLLLVVVLFTNIVSLTIVVPPIVEVAPVIVNLL